MRMSRLKSIVKITPRGAAAVIYKDVDYYVLTGRSWIFGNALEEAENISLISIYRKFILSK